MRTTSSFRSVGTPEPPLNVPTPSLTLASPVLGNIPAPRRAVAFGLTMHDGILLPGNAEPCVIPGGAVPPGQFAKSTEGATRLELGTMMLWEVRSEEHTSELQSRLHLVCRLLLEKKKKSVHRMCGLLPSTHNATNVPPINSHWPPYRSRPTDVSLSCPRYDATQSPCDHRTTLTQH